MQTIKRVISPRSTAIGARRGLLAPLVGGVSALAACSTSGARRVAGPPPVVAGIVDAHNRVRAKPTPRPHPLLPPLAWNRSAAEVARAYAAKCKFRHNSSRGPYGENLFAMSDHQTTAVVVPAAIRSWSSEAADYDLARNACKKSKVCGHYTQMIWRDTRHVGCAIQHCDKGATLRQRPLDARRVQLCPPRQRHRPEALLKRGVGGAAIFVTTAPSR